MPNRNFARVKAALDQLIQIDLSLSALSAQKSKFSDYRPRAAGEVASALSSLDSLIESHNALVRALVAYGNEYQAKDQTLAARNGPYEVPLVCYNFDEYLPPQPPAHEKSYLEKTLRHILLGEFSDDDDFTALGMAGEVGLGALGLDLPLDIRDIAGSAKKGDVGGAIFGTLMLIPGVGVLKPLRKIGKHADDAADGLHDVSKHADDIFDGLKKGDDLLPGKPSDGLDFGDDFKHGDDMLEDVPKKKPHKPIYPKGPKVPRNLTEEYIEDLRSISEFPDDIGNIDTSDWCALDPRDNVIMRKQSTSATKGLKEAWSKRHKQPWPTYVDPKTGKIKDYEMHHIRPLKYGGQNVVENITPLSFEQHRKSGVHSIHRAGGPYNEMLNNFGHPND